MHLVNYQGFEFNIQVNRTVSIFNKTRLEEDLSIELMGNSEKRPE